MKKRMIWMTVIVMLIACGARAEENRSAALRERVDDMWDTWSGIWSRTFLDGEVLIPTQWRDLPFVTWADEAPTLKVKEENGRAEITFSETLGEAWRVSLGKGIPVEYTACEYDVAGGCWAGEGAFDAVYLISDMEADRIGISVAYQRTDDFRPSCPVLEWSREEEDNVLAFSCIGWGTTRGFQGGMYAVATDQEAYYAEYDANGVLTAWYDGMTGCQYDAYDVLVEGEEPEGYEIPVVH